MRRTRSSIFILTDHCRSATSPGHSLVAYRTQFVRLKALSCST